MAVSAVPLAAAGSSFKRRIIAVAIKVAVHNVVGVVVIAHDLPGVVDRHRIGAVARTRSRRIVDGGVDINAIAVGRGEKAMLKTAGSIVVVAGDDTIIIDGFR